MRTAGAVFCETNRSFSAAIEATLRAILESSSLLLLRELLPCAETGLLGQGLSEFCKTNPIFGFFTSNLGFKRRTKLGMPAESTSAVSEAIISERARSAQHRDVMLRICRKRNWPRCS